MILYINACARAGSRTRRLAEALLKRLGKPCEEIRLVDMRFPLTDEAFLSKRDALISAGRFDDEMFFEARRFARADKIVIAAPYWDLSFPAALKQYIEQINVSGVTFRYLPEGYPEGLCRARALYYVSTAGGLYCPEEFGFGYVKALAQSFYGIKDVRHFKAEGLDIDGADSESILEKSIHFINETNLD